MSLTRICEACHKPIATSYFVYLHASLYETSGAEIQDPTADSYGEFCRPCVESGKAVRSLLALIDTSMNARKRKQNRKVEDR